MYIRWLRCVKGLRVLVYEVALCACVQTVQVPVYSEQEYQMYLHDDGWTKAETDHLFDLCKRFDLRFIVIHDRYDHQQYRVATPTSLTSHITPSYIILPHHTQARYHGHKAHVSCDS